MALLAARARQAFLEYNPIAVDRRRPRSASIARVATARWSRSSRSTCAATAAPNSENRQPALDDGVGASGRGAARVAEGAAGRAAARPGRSSPAICRSASSCRDGRASSRRSPTATPGRRSAASSRSPICCASSATRRIRNVVWITGDVHYCAAHHYDPTRATFTDFDPFWEFVAGPLHAGTFGPNALDPDVRPGSEVRRHPARHEAEPAADRRLPVLRHAAHTSAKTRALTAALHDLSGKTLWSVELGASA